MVSGWRRADLCATMNWIPLADMAQLDAIDSASHTKPVLLFKHSTTCGISRSALNRLERAWTASDDAGHTAYALDLLRFRAISNAVAERYGVTHESPQVLVIRNGKCDHTASHFGISYAEVISALAA